MIFFYYIAVALCQDTDPHVILLEVTDYDLVFRMVIGYDLVAEIYHNFENFHINSNISKIHFLMKSLEHKSSIYDLKINADFVHLHSLKSEIWQMSVDQTLST